MPIKKCLVLDLESKDNELISLWKKRESATSDFRDPLFHEVVAAGYALLDGEFKVQSLGVLGIGQQSEKDLLVSLVDMIDADTMVVTWAGRRFDMPVITYRCLKYGIPTPWDREASFRNRFRFEGHFDLQDHLMHHGASDVLRLDQVAALVGLPGKMDTHGVDVPNLIARNRFLEVGTYCVTDVIQTFVLFLRYALLLGLASKDEVNDALTSLESYYQVRTSDDAKTGYFIDEIPEMAVMRGIEKVMQNCDWKALYVHD